MANDWLIGGRDNVNYYEQKVYVLFAIIDITIAETYNYAWACESRVVNRIVNQIVNCKIFVEFFLKFA